MYLNKSQKKYSSLFSYFEEFKLLFISAAILIVFSSCEKDITTSPSYSSPTRVVLMDTLYKGVYTIPIGNHSSDFINIYSSLQHMEGVEIYNYERLSIATDNSSIAYVNKTDLRWYYNNSYEAIWDNYNYDQPKIFRLNDTITNKLNYTYISSSVLAWYSYSNLPTTLYTNYYHYDQNDLIGIGPFYIAAKTLDFYAWIKLELLDYSTLVIHSYDTSTDLNDFVIRE